MSRNNTRPVKVKDKNGKLTTVHKRTELAAAAEVSNGWKAPQPGAVRYEPIPTPKAQPKKYVHLTDEEEDTAFEATMKELAEKAVEVTKKSEIENDIGKQVSVLLKERTFFRKLMREMPADSTEQLRESMNRERTATEKLKDRYEEYLRLTPNMTRGERDSLFARVGASSLMITQAERRELEEDGVGVDNTFVWRTR